MPRRNGKAPAVEAPAGDTRSPNATAGFEARAVESPAAVPDSCFPIVGIGASAGGLEAFTQLLEALPIDTGMAFVLVQHLMPAHVSGLADILSRATAMPVREVRGESPVEPNHVYVIPPGRSMVLSDRVLRLRPREAPGGQRVIDHFLRTLAAESGHRAIGVILSGTASDGTLGLEAIKAEGGITFAQDGSARHDGMPHSAIASGCVDFVLPPAGIAREIVRIVHHPNAVPESLEGEPAGGPNLARIFRMLNLTTGVDFTHYKFSTFYRRVTRRMILTKIESLSAYVKHLQETPEEVGALYQDLLIGVTSFFRNPEAFEALKTSVFPRLVEGRPAQDPVRFWTIGCSTGQEAYSLAMSFIEFCDTLDRPVPLQLFATDLSPEGIRLARAGIYSRTITEDVSPERLRRFFVEVDGGYRIARAIRDVCVFSRHNVLADAPFSRLDLVSCRNLLIYLEPVLQEQIVRTLHYALNLSGVLWLGASETVGSPAGLFAADEAGHQIYNRSPGSGPGGAHFPLQRGAGRSPNPVPLAVRPVPGAADLHREADRLLLSRFAPPGVLVTADLSILQFRGDTGAYLAPVPGRASLSLPRMLREGLLVTVRQAVEKAGRLGAPVRQSGMQLKPDGGYQEVVVEAIPIPGRGGEEAGFLILFEGTPGDKPIASGSLPVDAKEEALPFQEGGHIRLAQELTTTREHLQSVIEQHEAANEELQTASEEIQSANEELQSANEELETSKEELQSNNEELATVNDELNNRNGELSRVNNDLLNLLRSVETAVVILGPDLRIRRFTPAAEKRLNLSAADVGRPLSHIKIGFRNLPDLGIHLDRVLAAAESRDFDVQSEDGCWFSLRLRPYRTGEDTIDGVVLTLVDVHAMKRAGEYMAGIVETVPEPLLVLDADRRVMTASRSYYRTFRTDAGRTIGRLLYDLGGGSWDLPALHRALDEALTHDGSMDDFEVEDEFESIGRRTMLLNARKLPQPGETGPLILLAIADITERKRLIDELREFNVGLVQADRFKNEFLAMLAHELRNPLAPLRNALEIIRMSPGNAPLIERSVDMMKRQVSQLIRLVDDLLDVSRISRGTIELRRTRIELAPAMNHAIAAVRPLCEVMKHELTVELPAEPVYLDADAVRMGQIVGNLLNNACKYTNKGGRIRISLATENGMAVIRVADNGIGIAADEIPRVFDLFTQVNSSLERSAGGLGIGLTLVRKLVEMHGGTVEAHSDGPERGSEFTVRLPVAALATEPPPEPSGHERVLPARRILVVDDNLDSAESLAMLLKLAGNETHTAHDGEEALEAAATFGPDVILLDIGLPKLNGYDVARRIRRESPGGPMVLVALTGWGQDRDRKKSSDAGFDAHLVKPVDHVALMRLLETLAVSRK